MTADAAAVAAASAWVRSLARQLRLAPGDIYRLDLCVSELVTNSTEYGYAGRNGGAIELNAAPAADGTGLRVEIADDGDAFDPLSVPPPQAPPTAADVRVGGFGIHLVRAYADECRYERRGRRNIFTFAVRPSPVADSHDPGGPVKRGIERRRAAAHGAFPLTRAGGIVVPREERSGGDRRLLGFISGCELFRNVPYALLEDVVARCPVREFRAGTVLLDEGQGNHHVALVLEGRIRVQLGSDEAPDFMDIAAGECAGEMSVIDGKPVSARVIAASDCRLLLIDREMFLARVLPIPEVARNLVHTLADRMRRSNDHIVGQIKASIELDVLQRELTFAHEVQAAMVPARMTLTPARPAVQCSGFMQPARQVGGDFYDAFYIERDRIAIMVGDVCGKGVPAALFMSRTLTLLRAEAAHSEMRGQRQHTLELISSANRQLCRNNHAGYFASVFVAILDVATGVLTWANAGHPAPVLARGSSEWRFAAEPRGLLLAVSEDAAYSVGETALPPGSTLFVYTDGLTEAGNPDGELYGEARLVRFASALRGQDAGAIVEAAVEDVTAFSRGHPRSDDLTLLALRYVGA